MTSKCIRIASTDILNLKIFSGEIPRTPLREGVHPSRALPHSCLRHSKNANAAQWPYHFSKTDDGPVTAKLICVFVFAYAKKPVYSRRRSHVAGDKALPRPYPSKRGCNTAKDIHAVCLFCMVQMVVEPETRLTTGSMYYN